ncbi:helix-turn-helix domain-containing protein [Streptomyces sp. SAS_270]|uniref:helix-turn-helix domain-containing protein n=1 Tax=Streptomyces sp. SAS_270 TaxID=3412748 RepID=UPI00403D38E3
MSEHLTQLLIQHNEFLIRAMAARWLSPLADLTPTQRERMTETLLAHLEGESSSSVATALGIHIQTLRYRMRQIEKLFGPALHAPRARVEIMLALKGRQFLTQRNGK